MMIEIEDLGFSYIGAESPAIDGISLSIPQGQFCGVIGANGSGKSSLCYALSGFIPHFFHGKYRGAARIAGRLVAEHTPAELAGDVGLVFENPFNQITGARFTVAEEIAFGLENLAVPEAEMGRRIEAALALTGLADLADRSPFALSGGQQQRLAVASMIAMRPQILVLDEPSSQLDPAGTRELFETLKALSSEFRLTIVLAEHKLDWIAAFAERVIALAAGRVILDGPAREVLASPLLIQHGIGRTRFTEAAVHCLEAGLVEEVDPLPVTLEQAAEALR
jgi:energy-coupling factor transporter ATP-binding protein EcfA2